MDITRDDWELTLNELKSQRLQMTLNMSVVNAGIHHIEQIIKGLPPKEEIKDE